MPSKRGSSGGAPDDASCILPAALLLGVHVGAGATIATVSAKGMSGGDPNEAARVAYESARRELERITPLHKEGIVSTKDYNAALQRVEEARSTLGAGAARYGAATAPVAGTVTSGECR